jgi:creatinine amidohydrolase/Fe(II)-dependent formamide hydrolase-like protein
MKYPGTISVREETFQALLTDICHSLKVHGFRRIVLIGDSGGNQAGMKAVAEQLSKEWPADKCRIVFIPEYYDLGGVKKLLEKEGVKETPEGLHDDFAMEATMLAIDPESIRMKQRITAGNFRINGVELAPAEKTIAWGKRIIEHRAESTAAAINKALAK